MTKNAQNIHLHMITMLKRKDRGIWEHYHSGMLHYHTSEFLLLHKSQIQQQRNRSIILWKRNKILSPYRWRLWSLHLQVVELVVHLEVSEDERNGVSGIGHDGPRTLSAVLVVVLEVRAGNHTAGTPVGSSTRVLRWRTDTKDMKLFKP